MAGVKGRSGGYRPGAGRKPAQKQPEAPPAVVSIETDPLAFLEGVMRGTIDAKPLQVRAAIAAAQYRHLKKGDGGVKDEAADRAKKASVGKFAASSAPLKLVGAK